MIFGREEDMVFTPQLSMRQQGINQQKMAEMRALRNDPKGMWRRIGRRFAQGKLDINNRLIDRYGKRRRNNRGPRGAMLRRIPMMRGGPLVAIAELAINAVVTGAMAVRAYNGGPTFEQQSAQFNRLVLGDMPAQARAQHQLRNHIFRNPMLLQMMAMGQEDEVYNVTRNTYEHLLQMEKAFDDVREKLPGAMTTLEMLIEPTKRQLGDWWLGYSSDNPAFRKVKEHAANKRATQSARLTTCNGGTRQTAKTGRARCQCHESRCNSGG